MSTSSGVGAALHAEVDFLARVEAAERRDNITANPNADPTPAYSGKVAATAPAAAAPEEAPSAAAAAPVAIRSAAVKRPANAPRTHCVHDETGGRLAGMAQQRSQQRSQRGPSGRNPGCNSGRAMASSVSRGTPRPAGGAPMIHTTTDGSRETTPRPTASAAGVRPAHTAMPPGDASGEGRASSRLRHAQPQAGVPRDPVRRAVSACASGDSGGDRGGATSGSGGSGGDNGLEDSSALAQSVGSGEQSSGAEPAGGELGTNASSLRQVDSSTSSGVSTGNSAEAGSGEEGIIISGGIGGAGG